MDILISNLTSHIDVMEDLPVSTPEQTIMDLMMQGMIDRWRSEILLSEGGVSEESKIEW
ncbi:MULTISPECIES: hypothetical protein [Winslowiella]|uniref:hypothetical protein n=1 Tax=Winslowiella TaxID=2997349 RepID=UPI0028BDC27B|nr:hypothetical protein [Winslowiella toletana]WNN44522.1 hypothetical protein RIN69_00975 [Winslowiella toletana]